MEASASKGKSRLPLKEIDDKNQKRIVELNGEFLNLYRVLGHHAHLLSAWIEFAYTLRRDCTTLRTLARADDPARRADGGLRVRMAPASALGARSRACRRNRSRTSSSGANRRASRPPSAPALGFSEAMMHGDVLDADFAESAKHFSASEIIELALTAGFYAMVPRVLNALQGADRGRYAERTGRRRR